MSHSVHDLVTDSGRTMYFEVDNSTNVIISHIFESPENLGHNTNYEGWRECTCGGEEKCTTYLNEMWGGDELKRKRRAWVCLNCLSIRPVRKTL